MYIARCGSFYEDAVLHWGPKKGPEFRELPIHRTPVRFQNKEGFLHSVLCLGLGFRRVA